MIDDARTHLEIRATTDSVWKSRLMSSPRGSIIHHHHCGYFLGKHRAEFEWQVAVEALELLERFSDTVKEIQDKRKPRI